MKNIKIDKNFVITMTIFLFIYSLLSSLVIVENYSCPNIAQSLLVSIVGTAAGFGVLWLIYKKTNPQEKKQ